MRFFSPSPRESGLHPWMPSLILGLAWTMSSLGIADDVTQPKPATARPNIVLIYADDIGYGDVGCYGATKVKTPHVDRLAREGLRFTDGHCASATCTPSRYAMLTGEYAWRKKGTGVLPGDATLIIEPGRTTMPAVLKQSGYHTAVVGKWHLGLGKAGIDWNGEITPGPLELGFDYAFLMPATGDRVPCVYVENHRVVGLDPRDPIQVRFGQKIGDEPTGKEHPELLRMFPSHGHDQTIINGVSRIGYMTGGKSARWTDEDMADEFVKKAKSFVGDHVAAKSNQPFFLYFASHDVHVPRLPHPRFAGKSELGPRGDAIVEFDWCVGELLAQLDELKIADTTLVILTSDNGPVVDDGYKDDAVEKLNGHKPAGPLRGGKYSSFEGGTRVPFIVRWPGRIKPGVSDAIVCQIDFPASFAALTGQSFENATSPDSENTLAAFLGDSPNGRETLVEHAGVLSLRQGSWKLIQKGKGAKRSAATNTELGNDENFQLYDLKSDLGETTNVAARHPDRVSEMSSLLEAIRAKSKPQ
jgi:arylsulfatase A-like enzyme